MVELHEAFLTRAATADGDGQRNSALGGFLLARLLDRLTRPPPPSADAIAYQTNGLVKFLDDAALPTNERASLMAVVAAIVRDRLDAGYVAIAVCDYAFWLESQLRLPEALDLLTQAELLCGAEAAARVQVLLQVARVRRMSGQYERARETYANAGDVALTCGDAHSERLSRIGRAIVHQKVGNLPESERLLREVIEHARNAGDTEAEARASHDLAVALDLMDRDAEAVPWAFRAFELYDDDARKLRALVDLGCLFRDLEALAAAEDAFHVVVARATGPEMRVHAMLELLELAGMTSDQLAFRRWRREIETLDVSLMPDDQVEFHLKLGMVLAVQGRHAEAERHLESAVQQAQELGLGELLFRTETALNNLRAGALVLSEPRSHVSAPAPAVHEVAQKVEALRGEAG